MSINKRNNNSKNNGQEKQEHRYLSQDDIAKTEDTPSVRKLMKYLKIRCSCPRSYNVSLNTLVCENCICVSKLLNAIVLLTNANISFSNRIEKDYTARYNGRTIRFRKDVQQFIDTMTRVIGKAALEKNNNNSINNNYE